MSQTVKPISASFTPAVREALDSWTNGMPEGGYLAFSAEMERAVAAVMERWGFDERVMAQGDVEKFFAFKRPEVATE